MKGVILAGGSGTRLRPITYSMAKQLVPVANKPILYYGLEHLSAAGIREVGIVIAPGTGDDIRAAVDSRDDLGIDVTYILQEQPLGLAHALKTALPFVDGDDVLMYLGDNLLTEGVRDIVDDFHNERPTGQILVTEVENPSDFGVVDLAADGSVVRLVEKPTNPTSNLALVGVYLFDKTIGEALDAITPSGRGEFEITDAIQYLVTVGRKVRTKRVTGWWKDTGKKEDLLDANRLVLSELDSGIYGVVTNSAITGKVLVGPGSRLVDCSVTGPAIIGRDVTMTRVEIGPNCSIGDRCRITEASIENSIVISDTEINGWRLRNSLLGRACQLSGSAPQAYLEMTLGDRSQIVLG